MADSDSGCVSAVADDNARTTDNLSIPPFLDRTAEAPTPEQLAGQPAIISPCAAVGTISVPAQVLTLTRRIKALIEKGDRAAEKAEQFYKAAGIHIKEIKQQQPDHWEAIVREKCALGRSRSYELIAIADGMTTLEKVRDRSNRSSKISHAKKSAVQRTCSSPPKTERVSVTDPPVTESPKRITQSPEISIAGVPGAVLQRTNQRMARLVDCKAARFFGAVAKKSDL